MENWEEHGHLQTKNQQEILNSQDNTGNLISMRVMMSIEKKTKKKEEKKEEKKEKKKKKKIKMVDNRRPFLPQAKIVGENQLFFFKVQNLFWLYFANKKK